LESGEHILKSENAPTLVSENLGNLISEKSSLLALWEERRILYEQCMDLQLFYRDTEQADTWMAKQEVNIIQRKIINTVYKKYAMNYGNKL